MVNAFALPTSTRSAPTTSTITLGPKYVYVPEFHRGTRFGKCHRFSGYAPSTFSSSRCTWSSSQSRSPLKLTACLFSYIRRLITFWYGTTLDHKSFLWAAAPIAARLLKSQILFGSPWTKSGFFRWRKAKVVLVIGKGSRGCIFISSGE